MSWVETGLQFSAWGLCVGGWAAMLAGGRGTAWALFTCGLLVSALWGWWGKEKA